MKILRDGTAGWEAGRGKASVTSLHFEDRNPLLNPRGPQIRARTHRGRVVTTATAGKKPDFCITERSKKTRW